MADDRLQAMKNMQAKAPPAPSVATSAAMGRDPNRATLSPGAMGAIRSGGAVGMGAQAAVDLAAKQDAAAKNEMMTNEGGTGMDLSGVFDALGDPSKPPNDTSAWEWDPKPNGGGPGHWVEQKGDSALPAGVNPGDPGTYFEGGTWKYGQKDALSEYNLPYTANDLLMGDETQFLMTPEEKAAAQAELDKQAAAGQWAQGNNMAAHGLGGSGVALTGLGDIAAKRMTAQNELETSDRAQAMAAYMDKLGLVLPATQNAVNEADKMKLAEEANMTDAERFKYQQEQDALANRTAEIANALGLTGADQLSPDTLAEGMAAYTKGDAAFQEWIKNQSQSPAPGGNGNIESSTNPGPEGFTGDYNALNGDQRRVVDWLESAGKEQGFDFSMVPPESFEGTSQESYDTLSDAEKANKWGEYMNIVGLWTGKPHGNGRSAGSDAQPGDNEPAPIATDPSREWV